MKEERRHKQHYALSSASREVGLKGQCVEQHHVTTSCWGEGRGGRGGGEGGEGRVGGGGGGREGCVICNVCNALRMCALNIYNYSL